MEEGKILRSVLRLVLDPPQLVYDDDKCSLCLFHYRLGDLIWYFLPCMQHVHSRCVYAFNLAGLNSCPNCNLRPGGVVQFNISPRLFYARDLIQDLQPDVVNVHEAPDILLFDADLDWLMNQDLPF